MKKMWSKKIAVFLVVAMMLTLMPVGIAFAAAPTISASGATIDTTGKVITVQLTGTAVAVGPMSTKHGWTVKAEVYAGTSLKMQTVEIKNVSIATSAVTINLVDPVAQGQKVEVTYKAPGDIDKAVRGSDAVIDKAVNVTTAITPTNGSTQKRPDIDWTNTKVDTSGKSVTVSFNGTLDSKLVYMTKDYGWTVERAAYLTPTRFVKLKISNVTIASNKAVINLVYDPKVLKTVASDIVKLSYKQPNDVDKRISSNGLAMNPVVAKQITNASTVAESSMGTPAVGSTGLAITVAVSNSTATFAAATTAHGWTVQRAAYGSSTFAAKQIKDVSATNGTITINLVDSAINKVLAGDKIQVKYTAPSGTAKILSTDGIPLANSAWKDATNGSTCAKPQPTGALNDTTYAFVYGTTLKVKITNIGTADVKGWAVKSGGKVIVVSNPTVNSGILTLTLGTAVTADVTVAYTKQTTGGVIGTTATGSLPMEAIALTTVKYNASSSW